MTNLEKCNDSLEYSYAVEEFIALKTEVVRQCEIFNWLSSTMRRPFRLPL
jgi:hypothetical protein